MESTIQLVLVVSIICLTLVFVAVGVWLVLLLKELRRSVKTVNDTAEGLTEFAARLSDPGQLVPGLMAGVKSGVEIIGLVKGFLSKDEKETGKGK